MTKGWRALGSGLLLALYPGALALTGVLSIFRQPFPYVPKLWLLLLAGLLWCTPAVYDLITGGWGPRSLTDILHFVLVTLVYLGGVGCTMRPIGTKHIASGLTIGITILAGITVFFWFAGHQRVAGWLEHPNMWGAAALLPITLLLLLTRHAPSRVFVALIGALVVIPTGSRASTMAFIVLLLIFFLEALPKKGPRYRKRVVSKLLIVLLIASSLAGLLLVQPRLFSSAIDFIRMGPQVFTPQVLGAPQALGVEFDEIEPGVVRVESIDSNWWSRVQYPMIIFPNTTYSFSLGLQARNDSGSAGLLGVVSGSNRLIIRQNGRWSAMGEGNLHMIDFVVSQESEEWVELRGTFSWTGKQAARLWIGPTPNMQGGAIQTNVLFRDFIAIVGDLNSLRDYAHNESSLATVEAQARISAYIAGVKGFLEKPWLGQRTMSFQAFYRQNPPTQYTAVPHHAHNALIQSLFDKGMIGTLGLLCLFLWLALLLKRGITMRGAWLLLLPVFIVNMFDDTLWSSGAILFLSAYGGMALGYTAVHYSGSDSAAKMGLD